MGGYPDRKKQRRRQAPNIEAVPKGGQISWQLEIDCDGHHARATARGFLSCVSAQRRLSGVYSLGGAGLGAEPSNPRLPYVCTDRAAVHVSNRDSWATPPALVPVNRLRRNYRPKPYFRAMKPFCFPTKKAGNSPLVSSLYLPGGIDHVDAHQPNVPRILPRSLEGDAQVPACNGCLEPLPLSTSREAAHRGGGSRRGLWFLHSPAH
jgi:hypothetical protein